MSLIKRLFGIKESQARTALSFRQIGQPVVTPSNYDGYSKQGFSKNVIVYRCVKIIATAIAGLKWDAYQKRKGGEPIEIESHPIIDLLEKPNPMMGQSSFFENVIGYYMLTGDTFIECFRPKQNSPPLELWPVSPSKMQIVPGPRGYPSKYVLKGDSITREWLVDPVKLKADILHMKSFNPTDLWWGLSPLSSALLSLDQSNAGQRWNLAMLQNSATPSGVMQVKTSDINPSGSLSEEQFARLKSELDNEYSGSRNAHRPMLLEGGLEWKQMSLSPKDMEFLSLKSTTAIDICTAFGVPSQMLGLGQTTYNNYTEARLSFYEDTVLPLSDMLEHELNNWLAPMFGEGLKICVDKDDIEALASKREAKYISVQNASWLTVNEKREATGYDPKEGWDVFVINNQIIETPEDIYAPETMVEEEKPQSAEEETETPDESEQGTYVDENQKGFKSFNLLNRKEKETSWRRQNRLRKILENEMAKSLEADFNEMIEKMAKSIEGLNQANLVEMKLQMSIDENMGDIKKTLERYIKRTIVEFGGNVYQQAKSTWPGIETKSQRKFEDWVSRYVKKRTGESIALIEGTTRKQVRRVVKRITEAAINEGNTNVDYSKELREEFPNLTPARAMVIARTEVASASNNANLEAVKSLDIPNMKKEWVSSTDDRVRDGGKDGNEADHEDMNGVQVDLDDKFTVPPDATMEGPGDPAGGADQVINCRCVLVFSSNN